MIVPLGPEDLGVVTWLGTGKYQRIWFRWGRAGDKGMEDYDMALDRPTHDPNKGARGGKPKGGNWSVLLPTLWEYLTEAEYSDGTARRPATLLLFAEDGLVKACLHDRDQGRSAWSSGPGEEECLGSLEEKLVSGTVEWRRDQKGGKK